MEAIALQNRASHRCEKVSLVEKIGRCKEMAREGHFILIAKSSSLVKTINLTSNLDDG